MLHKTLKPDKKSHEDVLPHTKFCGDKKFKIENNPNIFCRFSLPYLTPTNVSVIQEIADTIQPKRLKL